MSPVDRRNFLKGSVTALGAGGAGAARGAGRRRPRPRSGDARPRHRLARGERPRADTAPPLRRLSPERDHHPKAAQATFIALDSVAPTTTALFEGLQAISSEARLLTQGEPSASPRSTTLPRTPGSSARYNTPGLPDRDDRLRSVAVRPPLRPGAQAPAAAHRDAVVRAGRAGPDADRRRRAHPGVRRPARHRGPHRPRADARGRGPPHHPVDDRRLPDRRRDRDPKANTRNLFAFRDGTANPRGRPTPR